MEKIALASLNQDYRDNTDAPSGLMGGVAYSCHYHGAHIYLRHINVLPQPRKTFEDIQELAQDIAKKNLLNPLTVARFTSMACERYLSTVNYLWGASFRIEDLRSVDENGQEVFFILLAGERRFRACNFLWENGCGECLETYGQEEKGSCFQRHFETNGKIEVRLCYDIPPLAALFLQLSENTHTAIPRHEEAHAYAQLFQLLKIADPNYSATLFAREVGRSPGTIRHALAFCELPGLIQEAVANGIVSYGIALEITRLQNSYEISEEALSWWLLLAVTRNYKILEFREVISRHLQDKNSGQISLIDIATEEQEALQRKFCRFTVEKNTIQAIWSWIHYFGRVITLFEEGKLGLADSPFSERSPVKVFRKLLDQLKRLLPHLKALQKTKDYEHEQALIVDIVRLTEMLGDNNAQSH